MYEEKLVKFVVQARDLQCHLGKIADDGAVRRITVIKTLCRLLSTFRYGNNVMAPSTDVVGCPSSKRSSNISRSYHRFIRRR